MQPQPHQQHLHLEPAGSRNKGRDVGKGERLSQIPSEWRRCRIRNPPWFSYPNSTLCLQGLLYHSRSSSLGFILGSTTTSQPILTTSIPFLHPKLGNCSQTGPHFPPAMAEPQMETSQGSREWPPSWILWDEEAQRSRTMRSPDAGGEVPRKYSQKNLRGKGWKVWQHQQHKGQDQVNHGHTGKGDRWDTTPGTVGMVPTGNGKGRTGKQPHQYNKTRSIQIHDLHHPYGWEIQECFPAQQRAQVDFWEFCGICNHYKAPACPFNFSQGFSKLGRELGVFKLFIFQKNQGK